MNGRVSYSFDLEALQKSYNNQLKPIHNRSKSNLCGSSHLKFNQPSKLPFQIQPSKLIKKANLDLSTRFSSVKPQDRTGRKLSLPKSLNFSYRQQEAKKIFHENSRIFKRLSEISPIISFQRHKADYLKSQGYKRTISRASLSKNLKNLSFISIKSKFLFKIKRKPGSISSINDSTMKFPPLSTKNKLEKKKSEISLHPCLKTDSINQSSLNLSSFILNLLD